MHASTTIRAIALFEGAKGAMVFLAGFGLLSLVHRDFEHLAETAVEHAHLNPAGHYPHIFIEAATHLTDARLWMFAAIAAGYGTFRLAEAYGLWRERTWAEWLAVVSGGMYIPFEIYEIARGKGWVAIVALAVNVAIVTIMVRALLHRRRRRHAAPAS